MGVRERKVEKSKKEEKKTQKIEENERKSHFWILIGEFEEKMGIFLLFTGFLVVSSKFMI